MNDSAELFDKKRGPIVIMGNGPSLADIPDTFLRRYPTFGCNSVHLRKGFTPTYWAAADDWVAVGWWDRIASTYSQIPKFCLKTMAALRDGYDGPNLYTYTRREGPVWLNPKELHPGYLTQPGIAFRGIVHAMIQIAAFMGYRKFFLVGCDNTETGEHFYQEQFTDEVISADMWEWAFDTLQVCLMPRPIINLSTRGKIHCLPWADWKNL
jgi:hypothetical protein